MQLTIDASMNLENIDGYQPTVSVSTKKGNDRVTTFFRSILWCGAICFITAMHTLKIILFKMQKNASKIFSTQVLKLVLLLHLLRKNC
jgi:hypothetical protein